MLRSYLAITNKFRYKQKYILKTKVSQYAKLYFWFQRLLKNNSELVINSLTLTGYSYKCSQYPRGCLNIGDNVSTTLLYNSVDGNVTINSASLTSNITGDMINNEGEMTIYDVTLNSNAYTGNNSYTNVVQIRNSGKFTMSDGSFEGKNSRTQRIINEGEAYISNVTIPSISDSTYISNTGTLELTSVTIETNRSYGNGIETSGSSTLILNNVTGTNNSGSFITATNSSNVIINGGTYNLTSSSNRNSIVISDTSNLTVTGTEITDTGTYSTIYFSSSGSLNIPNSIITSSGTAINNVGSGIITIGIKGDLDSDNNLNLSTENPDIYGTTYGLYSGNSNATINFYDGRIGGNTPISASITDLEDGYEIVQDTIDGKNYKFLDILPLLHNVEQDKDYYNFEDALDEVENGETLKLLRNGTVLSTASTIEIEDGEEIILDLNNYTLSASNNVFIANDGDLTITDNSYFISYLCANLFAYLVIVLFTVVVYKTYNRLMRRTGSLLG